MNKMKFVIPARRGSKGFPFKNRKLFKYTAELVKKFKEDVIVTSDDEVIKEMSKNYNFTFHHRSKKNSSDTATTKDMMSEVINDLISDPDELIVMLYLTYPERLLIDIEAGLKFFNDNDCKSMLCKEKVSHSPYLMMYDEGNFLGTQVIKHDLCRRQDYRDCFRLCHFLCIFKASEIEKLNNNLYNKETKFMPRKDISIDVDTSEDLKRFLNDYF